MILNSVSNQRRIGGELLTTDKVADEQVRLRNDWSGGQLREGGYWCGKIPTVKGDWTLYYRDVDRAIRGEDVVVKEETTRDVLRIIELARQSADEGRTLPFA